ncbi:uncharacterized protein LOC105020893 isoform X2 [Esox lucius]|uniref:uncharacterized protein LOC105020893 isoform X2 n=1 Tax=Esox lucius TaxID=8010 RepID=UPI00147760B7|nr:uncharacterized protein LOC105020893 isoform X2 [Esox lucius]
MDLVCKPNVKSPIWVHFGFKPNDKGEPLKLDEAVCRLCRRIVFVKGGNTTNVRHHLRLRHPDVFSEFIAASSQHGYYYSEPSGSEQSQHYNDSGAQGNHSGQSSFGGAHGNVGSGPANDRPLHFIPDTAVRGEPWAEGGDCRAVGSLPPCLMLRRGGSGPLPGGSTEEEEEEEVGVFAKTLSLEQGWTFGPFIGELTRGPLTCLKYAWAIKENDSYYYVDATDENKSNWMRYVACAACEEEHNLTVIQYRGQIYYRVSQAIPEGTELKVWIGQEYAAMLGLGLGEHIKCEFGDKEILLQIFRDIQVVPVGGDSRPDPNGSYSWSDNSQSGSPLLVISDVSSGLPADANYSTFSTAPAAHQNANQRGLSVNFRYDFVKGSDKLLSPSQNNGLIWEFFGFEPDASGQPLDKDKVMCKLCGQHVDYRGTVAHLENHLIQTHHMKRRDVAKDGNKPWVSTSRLRPYHPAVGRPPLLNHPSTHRTSSNGDEDWTWSGSGRSAAAGAITSGPACIGTQGHSMRTHTLTSQTTNAIADFLVRDLLPLDIVEGEGFKQLIQTLLPSCKEFPSASLLEDLLRDIHSKGRKNCARQLTNSTGLSEDTFVPTAPGQPTPSSSLTRIPAGSYLGRRSQVPHRVAISAEVWRHDWHGNKGRWTTIWAHYIDADFRSHNLALATQRLGETGTGDIDPSTVEAKVLSVAQEWGVSLPSFVLLGGEDIEKTKAGPKKKSGEGVGEGTHHPNSTTFLEREDSVSSDDLSGLERAIERANSTHKESRSPTIPCFFTSVQACVEEVMGHSIISKTLCIFQKVLYSFFSLYDKDTEKLHPAKKLILVLQKQERNELRAWAFGKPSWNGLYNVVKTLLRYQNMISELLKEISECSEIQSGQDTSSPISLDSGKTAPLKSVDGLDTNSTSTGRTNAEPGSSNSSVPVPLKRSDWKVLEDLCSVLKPLDVACRTLAKEPFPRLSLVKPILTGLVDRHFASHPRHRNDSALLKELKKKIRCGLACRYNNPQINQELCIACALDPQFLGLGFMDVRDQTATFVWLKKEAVRIVEEDLRRAEAASRGGMKHKRKKKGSSSTTSSSGEMDSEVLRRSKRLKEITPVSFREKTASDSDESSANDDSESDNMEPDSEPASQQTGMEFLLGDLFSSQSQSKQPSAEERVDVEVSIFRAEKGPALGVEPLQWWNARSGQLPLLAKLARVYLAAPAIAGSAVQAFLQEGLTLHRKRTNIPPEGLDQMLFLHHNGLSVTI